ncbi:hypothetical protein [Vibrio lentus]|uniref:hypothetical protein n=1 Tax=Vibrio lentus TaxID=136468 RepID=UPI003D14CCAF
MVEYIKLFVELVGHLAWPLVVVGALYYFKQDLVNVLKRLKKAKYGDLELDLSDAINEVKNDAINAGITIMYSPDSFEASEMTLMSQAPEWMFMKSWQGIESLLFEQNTDGKRKPISRIVRDLEASQIIEPYLAELILKMYKLRNEIVHTDGLELTRGEIIEWLGISKSVADRLKQKLD